MKIITDKFSENHTKILQYGNRPTNIKARQTEDKKKKELQDQLES